MYNFEEASKNKLQMMVNIRRELHMHPEVDRDLNNTAGLVENYLKEFKINYRRYGNNGIIAELGSDRPGCKVIALRADMDALPVVDLKEVSYKSQNKGIMHACGHDAHTAILLGTASILKDMEQKLNGRVRLVFQPAEETDGGAREMIEYGALEGADAIIGLHVEESLDTGTVGLNRGVVMAASNPFKITVKGVGSHGASPQDGVDSIMIASKIINNLQEIVSREISATDSAVITIGKISGGTAPNAICSSIVMEGILRTLGAELRGFAKERIKTVVEMTAEMYRGNAEISFVEGYPSFENNKSLFDWFNNMVKDKTSARLIEIQKPSLGVEDFSYYSQVVPALFYKLGCRNLSRGITHPAHGSYFDIDEDCLLYGAMLQSSCALEFLSSEVLPEK